MKTSMKIRCAASNHPLTVIVLCIVLVMLLSGAAAAESPAMRYGEEKKSGDVQEDKKPSVPSIAGQSAGVLANPQLEVIHDAGSSNGVVHVEVIDPAQLTGHDYKVTFAWSEAAGDYVWDLDDMTASTLVLSDQPQDGASHNVDGFAISVTSPYGIRAVVQVADQDSVLSDDEMDDAGRPYGGNNVWADTSSYNDVNGRFMISRQTSAFIQNMSRRHDYEMRFTSDSTWAKYGYSSGNYLKIPVQLWDIGENTPADTTDDKQMVFSLYEDVGTADILDIPNGNARDAIMDSSCSDRFYFFYLKDGLTYEALDTTCNAGHFSAADTMWNAGWTLGRIVIADYSLHDDTGNLGQKLLPAPGTRVRFLSNMVNTQADTFAFNTTTVPQMWASVWDLHFFEVPLGDSLSKQVVLENIGGTVLTIDSMSCSTPPYHVSFETTTLAVGEDTTLTVTFAPVDASYYQNSVLTIHASDRDYLIDLTSTAIWTGDFRKLDGNNISMWVDKNGVYATNPFTPGSGLFYAADDGDDAYSIIYSAGLWLAGDVEGDTRTACVTFGNTEYQPGRILSPGVAEDPDLSKNHVYKISRGEHGTSGVNPDYDDWPAADGAPVDGYGDPLFYGDQQIWYVMNDLVESSNRVYQKSPIGLEVQTLFWAYDSAGPMEDMIFGRWRIIHKGTETLDSCYVGFFSDPDIGDPSDDYNGCDSLLHFGYAYNGNGSDDLWGDYPPATGFKMLSDSMSSYIKFFNGGGNPFTEPINWTTDGADQVYNNLQGLDKYGNDFIDPTTGHSSVYVNSGDPVTSTGWLASDDWPPTDIRMVPSSGPYTFAPGDTHDVYVAIIVGRGVDNLNSVTVVKGYTSKAQQAYDNDFWMGDSPEEAHFTPVNPTGRTQPVYISDAVLEGLQLQPGTGDAIGIFDSTICVGAATVTSFPMTNPIVVQLEYTPPGESTLPGARNGKPLLFKVWDQSEEREADAKISELITGTAVFSEGSIVAVKLSAPMEITQNITIQNGMLNLISFNVDPIEPDAEDVFDGLTNFQVAFNDEGEYRIPPDVVFPGHPGTNTIGSVACGEGYSVYITGDTPQVLSVYGPPVYVPDVICSADNGKLNKIAFLQQEAQPIADVFNATANPDLWSHFITAFDDQGQYYIPPDIVYPGHTGTNTVGNMIPGKGYSLYHNGSAPISYTFPEPAVSPPSRMKLDEPELMPAGGVTVVETGEPHAVFVKAEGSMFEDGDVIAVYAGGRCVGRQVWRNDQNDPLVIWQAVPECGLPGVEKGDTLCIRRWIDEARSFEDIPVTGDICFEPSRPFSLLIAGESCMDGINQLAGILPEKMELYQNYPNPFNPSTTIRFDLNKSTKVSLIIYNIQGRQVTTLVDKMMAGGRYEVVWKGQSTAGDRIGSGVYVLRMETDGFVRTRKLLLVQ